MDNNFDCARKSLIGECMIGELETWKECKGCDIEEICKNCTYQLEDRICKECTQNFKNVEREE